MLPSQGGIDLTVECEVSSKKYYIKHYTHPEWPGEQSGPTVGIGYDLGQASPEKIRRDWSGRVPDAMLELMVSCSGHTGAAGNAMTAKVKSSITISWELAIEVFMSTDVPEYSKMLEAAVPGASALPADCFGSLFSVVYNRGAGGFNLPGDRYREMRDIKAHIASGNLKAVEGDLRSMARLWSSKTGLPARRNKEADLWALGLSSPATKSVVLAVKEAPPTTLTKQTPPHAPGAASAVLATTAIIIAKSHHALTGPQVAGGIIVGLAIAFVLYKAIQELKPTLARAKA